MIFFSSYYLYLLLLSPALFWLIPGERTKTWFIVTASSMALFSVQPAFTIFLICLVIFIYFIGNILNVSKSIGIFSCSIVLLTVVLLGFKYAGNIWGFFFAYENEFSKSYLIPIGISYLSFKLIAYIIDVYRGEIQNPKLDDLLAFVLFIPTFPAGPIERFQRFAGVRSKSLSLDDAISGLQRILLGFFKKLILVNLVINTVVFEKLEPVATGNEPVNLLVLAFLIGALIYAYLDLSAYADIAIGFGKLFGYQVYENMNYPIFRQNLSEYWNNWHMSLSHWCRNYVYFPVIGYTRNNMLALYASFVVMGLWHNVSLTWLFWGFWHATGITIYSHWSRWKRKLYKKGLPKLPMPMAYTIGMLITIIYSGLGFAFITQKSLTGALTLLSNIIK